jgi:signal transduction histidine kinase
MLERTSSPLMGRLLRAEEMAAEYLGSEPPAAEPGQLRPTAVEGVLQFASPDESGVGLYEIQNVHEEVAAVAALNIGREDADVWVLRPAEKVVRPEPFLLVEAGVHLPGWQLALTLQGEDPFADATRRQVAVYTWTAVLVMGFTAFVTLVVGRQMLRQTRLAKLKNDFIATVSHELKTPLASMRVLVDTLLSGHYRDQQQVTDYLELIAHENQRLSRLIDNFLSFSRMERNKRAFVLEEIAPDEVAYEAAEVVRSRFADAGVRFEESIADDMPAVSGDFDALVTVLVNLLDNAFKYTGDDKAITLRAWSANSNVLFQVADNGIGMSRRAVRRVFDRFYQVDQSLARQAEGCGLGLSIVKFILEAHRGRIDVESEPGQGSRFTVTLPASAGGDEME